jgi:enolase
MSTPTISAVNGRRVWDSRGDPTVEVELTLDNGLSARGIAPAGASTGRHEAIERRDGDLDPHFGGRDVHGALTALRIEVAPALRGRSADDPEASDRLLASLDPTPGFARIGGNTLIAASLALWRAAAAIRGQPLWRLLARTPPRTLPRPEIQIIGGGAHAAGRLDLQDLMVVPLGDLDWAEGLDRVARVQRSTRRRLDAADRFGGFADEGGFWPWFARNTDALDLLTRAIEDAGLRPGEDIALSIDVAASQLLDDGAYRLRLEDRRLDAGAWSEWLAGLVRAYPIRLLEDPFGEDALDATATLRRRLENCAIVGDDLVATRADRILAAGAACDAVLIKPNQAGTLSLARDALAAARTAAMMPIVSARSGETEDSDIVDIAIGWTAPMIKVGALARGERTAKWNQGLRIAEALGNPPLAPFPRKAGGTPPTH